MIPSWREEWRAVCEDRSERGVLQAPRALGSARGAVCAVCVSREAARDSSETLILKLGDKQKTIFFKIERNFCIRNKKGLRERFEEGASRGFKTSGEIFSTSSDSAVS